MPRPRKAAKLLAISGAYANHPKRRRKDVEAAGPVGAWSDDLPTDHAAVWDEITRQSPAGILTAADRVAMEYAVRLTVELRRDPAKFSASKGALLVNLLGKLGCLPASRMSMSLPDPKDKHDPAEKYFA